MRAFVITGPGQGTVRDIDPPSPSPGQVVVDVERAGVCGTDREFFTGHMAYLRTGEAHYPVRIGHEWCGVVVRAGDEAIASWVGRRVTGDTMLGCGWCRRCLGGRQHLCAERYEIGIRGGWPGALAEQLLVPASALHPIPAGIDATAGALVEPGGNAMRAVRAALAGGGQRLLVMGPGTIGLLAAQIARSLGAEVHLLGRDERSLRFARDLGFGHTWFRDTLPDLAFDAVLDASTAQELPSLAAGIVEPGGCVVYIGLSAEPSLVDTRTLVLKDVTATGVLSASGGLGEAISLYASGAVDPRPIVAATVGLEQVATVLAGQRPPEWSDAPKVHIDPQQGLATRHVRVRVSCLRRSSVWPALCSGGARCPGASMLFVPEHDGEDLGGVIRCLRVLRCVHPHVGSFGNPISGESSPTQFHKGPIPWRLSPVVKVSDG